MRDIALSQLLIYCHNRLLLNGDNASSIVPRTAAVFLVSGSLSLKTKWQADVQKVQISPYFPDIIGGKVCFIFAYQSAVWKKKSPGGKTGATLTVLHRINILKLFKWKEILTTWMQ